MKEKQVKGGDYMNKPYRVCPYCNAHLDSGEHCDCRDSQQSKAINDRNVSRQAAGNQHRPVLDVMKLARSAG